MAAGIRLPSWNRRGGAKRRGGSPIQKFPFIQLPPLAGSASRSQLPSYPGRAVGSSSLQTRPLHIFILVGDRSRGGVARSAGVWCWSSNGFLDRTFLRCFALSGSRSLRSRPPLRGTPPLLDRPRLQQRIYPLFARQLFPRMGSIAIAQCVDHFHVCQGI